MTVVDQKVASCYIWIITGFLFVCIAAGGAVLAIYMNQPDASSWYAIAGISLVCLPWFFWFLIFLYRLLSRRFGFRIACWGASVDSLPGTSTNNAATASGDESNNRHDETGTNTMAMGAGAAWGPPSTIEEEPI